MYRLVEKVYGVTRGLAHRHLDRAVAQQLLHIQRDATHHEVTREQSARPCATGSKRDENHRATLRPLAEQSIRFLEVEEIELLAAAL